MAEVKPDKHGWMPIETAPRDWSDILVWNAGESKPWIAYFNTDTGKWTSSICVDDYLYFPESDATHWQPLLPAPEGQ